MIRHLRGALYSINILCMLSSAGFAHRGGTSAQTVAIACKTKISGNEVIGCLSDRPCILWLRRKGQKLQVAWDGQGDYDTYNFRWSEAGKTRFRGGLQGGRSGVYEVHNLHSCSVYFLNVQGCRNRAPGRARCTAWATASFSLDD